MKFDNTYTLVSKLNKAYVNEIESGLKKYGYNKLALSHGTIIMSLLNRDNITMLELSKSIDKTPQTTTTLVKKLVDLGYVKIEHDNKDRRITRVKILDSGRELGEVIINISQDIYLNQYKSLTEEEISNFRETLKKIINNLI